jgi:glycosyltransferase involved in cell wall biosynthesis
MIVGKGPAEQSLKKLKQKLGLKNVEFKGYAEQELLPFYYSAADAFITASTSETQSVTIVEAMACGCQVIGANSLAIPEVVEKKFLFEPSDVVGLRGLVENFPTKGMQRNVLKTAKQFSIERCTDRLERFYEEVL